MPKLPKLGRELGFESDKNIVYGMYEGYHVTMYHKLGLLNSFLNPTENFKKLFVTVGLITDDQSKKLLDFVHSNKKDLIVIDGYIENSVLLLVINEDLRSYSVKRFNQTMTKLVQHFKSEGIVPETKCAYCGEEGVNNISILDNVSFPSHKACEAKA